MRRGLVRPRALLALLGAGLLGSGCSSTPKQTLDATVDGGSEVRWLAGDSTIAVGLLGRGVAIVDAETGEERAAWRLPTLPDHAAHGLATSAGGETLAVATNDSVRVVRARDGKQYLAVAGGGQALALSGDGRLLAMGDGTAGRVVDTRDGRVLAQVFMLSDRNGLAWSPDDDEFAWTDVRQLLFLSTNSGHGAEGDSISAGGVHGEPTGDLGPFVDARPTQLAYSGNGRTLAVAESTDYVSFWDTRLRHLSWRLKLGGRARFERMALSADTWYLATARDGRARILWAYTGRRVADWSPHAGAAVRDMAFSHDGRRLATVGADGHVRVWQVPPPGKEHR